MVVSGFFVVSDDDSGLGGPRLNRVGTGGGCRRVRVGAGGGCWRVRVLVVLMSRMLPTDRLLLLSYSSSSLLCFLRRQYHRKIKITSSPNIDSTRPRAMERPFWDVDEVEDDTGEDVLDGPAVRSDNVDEDSDNVDVDAESEDKLVESSRWTV
jgi:hypothetical protein